MVGKKSTDTTKGSNPKKTSRQQQKGQRLGGGMSHVPHKPKSETTKTRNGKLWVTIARMFRLIKQVWKVHNETVHAKDSRGQDIDVTNRTKQKVLQLHELKNECLPVHRDQYFFTNVHETINGCNSACTRSILNIKSETITVVSYYSYIKATVRYTSNSTIPS